MTRPIKPWIMAFASIVGLASSWTENIAGVLFIWFVVWMLIHVEEPQ